MPRGRSRQQPLSRTCLTTKDDELVRHRSIFGHHHHYPLLTGASRTHEVAVCAVRCPESFLARRTNWKKEGMLVGNEVFVYPPPYPLSLPLKSRMGEEYRK